MLKFQDLPKLYKFQLLLRNLIINNQQYTNKFQDDQTQKNSQVSRPIQTVNSLQQPNIDELNIINLISLRKKWKK